MQAIPCLFCVGAYQVTAHQKIGGKELKSMEETLCHFAYI